jgi:transposase
MKLLEEYETSGLPQKEFAAKHDVSLNTLQYWLSKRTKRAPRLESNTPTKFLLPRVTVS